MATLLGPAALHHMTAAQAHYITGRSFFPHLISAPFGKGLAEGLRLRRHRLPARAPWPRCCGAASTTTPSPAASRWPVEPAQEAVAETEPLLVS